MAGVRLLSHFQIGKEVTKGTAVAATRMLFPDLSSTFSVDFMKTYHEGRRPGYRNPVQYATRQGERVNINFRTMADTGIAFDEVPFFSHFPAGGTAGSGSTAYTWTHAWGGTAAGSALSLTAEYGDDVQNYEAEYCFPTRISVSADPDGMTQLTADIVGRQSTKSTKTSLTPTTPVLIPGYLWVPKWASAQASLSGASTTVNFLRSWNADWTTGLLPHRYLDGNDYFGQNQESAPVEGTMRLVVDSNATAVSQFYDKAAASTVDFLRLTATSASIIGGGTAYSWQLDFALEYQNVQMLASDIDGVNTYEIEAKIVVDGTWGKSIESTVVNSLANLSS